MEDLIKQLNNLNKIQPSVEWKSTARKEILAQIRSENSPSQLGKGAEFFYWLKFSANFLGDFVMRPAGTLVLIFFLVLGGGILKVKADSALPGDFLYALKRGEEKVQLALVFDEKARAEMRLELANRRLEELKKILVQNENSREEAEKALENFHKDFTLVKGDIKEASGVDLAKQVEDKTNDFQFLLSKAKDKLDTPQLDSVLKDVENTNMAALEVIAKTDSQEAQSKINSKIEDIETQAKKKGQKEALAKLKEAKEELDKKNFVAALQKVKESKEILNSKEADQEAAGQEVEEEVGKGAKSTTSQEIENVSLQEENTSLEATSTEIFSGNAFLQSTNTATTTESK